MSSRMIMATAYDQGAQDFKAGKAFYANPYALPIGTHGQFSAWQAGWCFAWQAENVPKEPTK